jgi:ATP-dependent RNA helicase RhlE
MENGFKELKVTKQFIRSLDDIGITEPTPIQAKTFTVAFSGQDVLAISQTGSGKTIAFLLPLLMQIKYTREGNPRALILAPAKELVVQIYKVLVELAKYTDIRSVCLYGGVGKTEQIKALEEGCDVIVATPGRFIDLYSYGYIHTRSLKHMVLDEADRMMEMGFMPQLRQILEVIPVKRQNLLFSATFPERVENLAAEFLEFPTRIKTEFVQKPVKQVEQFYFDVPNFKSKLNLLTLLLKDSNISRAIVFCNTKDAAERVSRFLTRTISDSVRVLHGNKGQNTRINALEEFSAGNIRVLVTTDVSSRGIDIEYVSHVFNFELPKVPEDYIHRIGRTARINREGVALSFVNHAERIRLQRIEEFIESKIDPKELPEGFQIADFLPGEKALIDRLLDEEKKRRDPNYKGAFHQKKKSTSKIPKKRKR